MTTETVPSLDKIIYAKTGISAQQFPDQYREIKAACEAYAEAIEQAVLQSPEVQRLREALIEGRRAIGEHIAPHDCYATGPMTGDPIRDLVECPACSFVSLFDAAMKEQP